MKKIIYLQYLLAHLLLMVVGGMLTVVVVTVNTAVVSPLWGVIVLPMAFAAYFTGRKLNTERLTKKRDDYWNTAIVMYVISLALLLALWKLPENAAVRFVNSWNFPTAPVLLGFDAWIGNLPSPDGGKGFYALLRSTEKYHSLYLPVMGAVLAAAEPLCLTLGFLSGAKNRNEENENNA